jgi:hypothetical protein
MVEASVLLEGNDMSDEERKGSEVDNILAEVEEDVFRNERMIKLSIALEYMIQLVEPKYKEAFIRAERNARSVEEMNRILELARKHIGQRTAITILGI